VTVISGYLSPRHGVSSGCGWRKRPTVWRAAAAILDKQSWTTYKGWSSSFGVGLGVKTPRKNLPRYETFHKALDLVSGSCKYGNEPSASNKMWRIFWLAENRLAAQEVLCSMETTSYLVG
jgi:hypothetical protein